MIKNFFGILVLVFPFYLIADQPNLEEECKNGFRSYQRGSARVDLCSKEDGNYKVDAVSYGGNSHRCWFYGTTKRVENTFVVENQGCKLAFEINSKELEAAFEGSCNQFCGVRADLWGGKFLLQ